MGLDYWLDPYPYQAQGLYLQLNKIFEIFLSLLVSYLRLDQRKDVFKMSNFNIFDDQVIG